MVASLKRRGHVGQITSFSRRGLRSRGHGPVGQEPFGDFLSEPFTSESELLHKVRHTLREAEERGMTWHSFVDALGAQGRDIWENLRVIERRRVADTCGRSGMFIAFASLRRWKLLWSN